MNNLFRNITPVSRMVRKTFVLARYSTATGSKEYIESLVKGKKIVIFMKGTPDAPRCGFSNAVVTLLKYHGVLDYDAHNVLEDEDLRQGENGYNRNNVLHHNFLLQNRVRGGMLSPYY